MSALNAEGREVLSLARQAAAEFGLGYVGTEHLLLGLVRQPEGKAAAVLRELGVHEYNVLPLVQEHARQRMQETWVLGRLPGTPHYCDVLSRAQAESRGVGNWQIGSEHLLLALLAQPRCTGLRVLAALQVTPEAVRKVLCRLRTPVRPPAGPAD